jgi:hypothetical protein
MLIVQFNAQKNKDNIRTLIEDWKDKADIIFIREPEIFSMREEYFISGDSRLYILYQPEIKETRKIRVIILVATRKDIRADMRIDLTCNKDMLVMDIQEKDNKKKKGKKIRIVNVYNQRESGRILDKVIWDRV